MLAIFCGQVRAQDERYFRQLFTGEFARDPMKEEKGNYYLSISSPVYHVDLDDDGREERLIVVKHDGEDWIYIENHKRERIFSYKFTPKGGNSGLYRVNIRRLSKDTKIVLLQYYEGFVKYLESRGTARLYMMTIDKRDLSTIAVTPGPNIWDEHKDFKEHYHQRSSAFSLVDFNNNGIREVAVRYHLITRVYFYNGSGKWKTFD
jgi:hypothetical protein